jgi:hypothetical protein
MQRHAPLIVYQERRHLLELFRERVADLPTYLPYHSRRLDRSKKLQSADTQTQHHRVHIFEFFVRVVRRHSSDS